MEMNTEKRVSEANWTVAFNLFGVSPEELSRPSVG